MTPERQRIRIAELCGWSSTTQDANPCAPPTGIPPGSGEKKTTPDYLNSLDAMHEAEEILTMDQSTQYVSILWPQGYAPYRAVHATAPQRAEAFLKTLGAWED